FSKSGIRARIQMTDLDVLKTVFENFGGSIVSCKKSKDHYKQTWLWFTTSSKDSYDFIQLIIPFLHSRRTKRAREALKAYELMLDKQKEKSQSIVNIRTAIRSLKDS